MDIAAFIPARAGSKGIPRKNMIDLNGKPLLKYSFDAAKNSRFINRILLSTDDEEFAEYGKENGIDILMRPDELANDTALIKDVIRYHLLDLAKSGYEPDIFILLQPTSPLRTEKHIDEALKGLIDDPEADAVVSLVEVPHEYLPMKIMKTVDDGSVKFYQEDGEKFVTRQTMPHLYARNGAAIYAVYTKVFLETGSLYGTRCIPYFMKEEESIDIDSYFELFLVESIMKYYDSWHK